MSTTDVTVTGTVHDSPQRPAWANTVAVALTVLLVAYAFGWLGWLVAAAVVYIAARVGWWWYTQQLAAQAAAQREHTAIAPRADQQHAWVLAGDDRGIYGKYPPAAV